MSVVKKSKKRTDRDDSRRNRLYAGWRWLWSSHWAGLGGLVLLVLVVYWPTFSGGFIWDDDQHVQSNEVLRSASGLADMWIRPRSIPQYYPLVHTTFWIEYHLWGVRPAGYHVVNVLLHATSVLLLWRLLERLAVPGAWLAAAVFAIHPVHVETVAWITERKNVLSLVFALGSMLAYLRFDPADGQVAAPAATSRRWRFYGLALGLYVAALLSKTVTSSVPAVLLVVYWWKEGRIFRHVLPLLPFFAIGLALSAVTVWIEHTHVGAQGEEWYLTGIERCLVAGRAAWFYAGKLFWPYPLMFFYPRWTVNESVTWQYMFPAAVVALLVGLWLARGRIGRGPLAAVLIFGGVLVPALGFINVYPFRYSYVADHFQYHASVAMIALICAGLTLGAARLGFHRRRWAWVGGVVLLLVLGGVARDRTHVFANVHVLYEQTLAHNPDCWAAHGNLGDYWLGHKRYDAAMAEYRAALRTTPPIAEWPMHIGLGNCFQDLGRPSEALAEYDLAFRHCPPEKLWVPHLHSGSCLQQLRDNARALAHYEEAMRLEPKAFTADNLLNVAICLQQLGYYERSLQEYEKYLAQKPAPDWPTYFALGECLDEAGRHEEAVRSFEQAWGMNPRFPPTRSRLALALFRAGRAAQAEDELRRNLEGHWPPAVRAEALDILGRMAAEQGKWDEAIGRYRESLALVPEDWKTLRDYGLALKAKGDMAGAILQLEKAIGGNPYDPFARHGLGTVLLAAGRNKEAVASLRVAVAQRPVAADYCLDLARAEAAIGDWKGTESSLRAFLSVRKGHAEGQNLLGVALRKQGREEEAVAAFQAALAIDPKHAGASENLKQNVVGK